MFAFVFLKAFQQRNGAFNHYWPVIPTSWLMFATEAYVVVAIARRGWDLWFVGCVGTAAGVGAVLAVYIHNRVFRQGAER